MEHFCTLFDQNFLPIGLSLYNSLEKQSPSFHLWVICMDEEVCDSLQALKLQHMSVITLPEIESEALLETKNDRSRREYCWTLTPFTFSAVFEKNPSVRRVTYLDADTFLLDDPQVLIAEMEAQHKNVLITEHAYAPEYYSDAGGRFCVQFLTINNNSGGREVMTWWQDRCLEWCYDRVEDGKFGDQKYLEQWPDLFGKEVHIVQQVNKTLAPWNASYFSKRDEGSLKPTMYHFHGLRIFKNRIRLYEYYYINSQIYQIYQTYLQTLLPNIQMLQRQKLWENPQTSNERLAEVLIEVFSRQRPFRCLLNRKYQRLKPYEA